jgi:hypothetical protein
MANILKGGGPAYLAFPEGPTGPERVRHPHRMGL